MRAQGFSFTDIMDAFFGGHGAVAAQGAAGAVRGRAYAAGRTP